MNDKQHLQWQSQLLERIKQALQTTIDTPIPSHCHCCPNPYEEALETERDYAEQLLDSIKQWEADQC